MGKGIIRVSNDVFGEGAIPVTLEEWRKRLLLPEMYKVIDIAARNYLSRPSEFRLTVESDEIQEDAGQVWVTPIYSIDYVEGQRGAPRLERVDILYPDEVK
jgi:hypothetical protein